jgi:hypothetical protein
MANISKSKLFIYHNILCIMLEHSSIKKQLEETLTVHAKKTFSKVNQQLNQIRKKKMLPERYFKISTENPHNPCMKTNFPLYFCERANIYIFIYDERVNITWIHKCKYVHEINSNEAREEVCLRKMSTCQSNIILRKMFA